MLYQQLKIGGNILSLHSGYQDECCMIDLDSKVMIYGEQINL
jgi:hypothetical protein